MTNSKMPPPAPDARDGEFRRVVRHPHVYHAFIAVDIVGAVRNGRALCQARKIVDIYPRRLAFLPPFPPVILDRKSTRLNSSHVSISYAVFCLKKKNKTQ